MLELLRCEYLDRRENPLLVGGPRRGRTHPAKTPGMRAYGRGKCVLFYRSIEVSAHLPEVLEDRRPGRMKS